MPAQYIPQQMDFNEIIPERRNPSIGLPFSPHAEPSIYETVDRDIFDELFKKHRSFIVSEIKNQNPLDIMQLANIYFLKGNYPKAEGLYSKVIRAENSYLPAYDKIILSILLQFPKDFTNSNPLQFELSRDKLNRYYLDYLDASNKRPDILHNYIIFRLSMFVDQMSTIADESLKNLHDILKIQPKNFAAMDTIGFVYLNLKNDIGKAKLWFSKALQINSTYPFSLNNFGACLVRENKAGEAKEYFTKLLKINDRFSLAYENLGNIQVKEEDYKNAFINLQKALSIEGTLSGDGYHNLAWLYGVFGQYDKSIEIYQLILVNEPDNYLVMNNLGTAYVRLGNREAAKKYYLGSLKLYKNKFKNTRPNKDGILQTLHNLARTAIDTKDMKLIDETEADLTEIEPKDTFIAYIKACKELLNENYIEAKKEFKKLLKKDKGIPEAYVMYSFILSAIEKNYSDSILLLKKALEYGYTGILIDNNLAYAYLNLDKTKDAEKILHKYEDSLPSVLIPTKGMLELRKGNIEEGNKWYKKAVELFESNSKTKKELMQIWMYEQSLYWFRKGEKTKAKDLLIEAEGHGETYFSSELEKLKEKVT